MTETYPRKLNGTGCLFGQRLDGDFLEFKKAQVKRMDNVEKKLDRLTWAAVLLSISLMTASLTMWITYIGP